MSGYDVTPRTVSEIVIDRLNTNDSRAGECLRCLDLLTGDDLARPDYRAAAITFGLLAVADALAAAVPVPADKEGR